MRPLIVAEVATNHGGDIELACRMVEDAARCGVDVVKFQAHQSKHLNPDDPQAVWLRQAELSDADLTRLAWVCRDNGVRFLATAYTPERFAFLRGLSDEVKIGSGEAGSEAMRDAAVAAGFSRIYIGCGLTGAQFGAPFVSMACVTAYPAPLVECCLASALAARQLASQCDWGYSDHYDGLQAIEFALELGASVIECHCALAHTKRRLKCDKTPHDLREIVQMAKEGTRLGMSYFNLNAKAHERYFGRWTHGT